MEISFSPEKKKEIVKDPDIVEYFLEEYPEIFKENKFELAEYALVNGYIESFRKIFHRFPAEVKILFEYGFFRERYEIIEDIPCKYERMHKNYLKCFLDDNLAKEIYGEE